MICRAILPQWAKEQYPELPTIVEGDFTPERLEELNTKFYNIHYLPNYPSVYEGSKPVDGSHIDVFNWVFVDMDLKDNVYATKGEFIEHILASTPHPTRIIDSGNGVHVYWQVSDLDAMSFLKLQRRLMRKFNTDPAVAKIFQLMRPPGYVNTKYEDSFKLCEEVYTTDSTYTCEEMDAVLPQLTREDAEYCEQHFNKTYAIASDLKVDDTIPVKFTQLISRNKEVKQIWAGGHDDRSGADYRLGHIMFASGFTKAEATSVLVNSPKALARAPVHRINYATGIVDKIWTYELTNDKELSYSVRDILKRAGDTLKGTRFPCWKWLDDTHHGFRLGQVIGLVAGSGVGKTAVALNMFEGFVQANPDYIHFFIPLEQPAEEIADRWRTMCGENTHLHDKVHVMSNYAPDGSFRHLSLDMIKEYLLEFQISNKVKVGCVVIDHIGALKKKSKDGENQGIVDICHEMKAFAIQTNTMLVMQSQSSREKAGIGDLELDKDAAYGTVYFEAYCDYLVTIWQPLKRCYTDPACPTVTAFKFCKIRHKKKGQDGIQEDVRYTLFFESETERLRELTQDEETSLTFFNNQACNKRSKDKKTEVVPYVSARGVGGLSDGKREASTNQNATGTKGPTSLH